MTPNSPDDNPQPAPPRSKSSARRIAGAVALAGIGLAIAGWMLAARSPSAPGLVLDGPNGMMAGGGVTLIVALVIAFRDLSFTEALELAWEILGGLLEAVGAVLSAIWGWLRGLVGLD